MLLVSATGGDFKWWASNGAARPAATYGTAITPGTAPTMGSWTQLLSGAAVVNDVYGVLICINSFSSSATTRNVHIDIGVDNAGGTNYVTKIPYLLGGHAAPYNVGSGGCWYYFPLYIPAGSSIAARGAGNVTTAGYVYITVFGQPRRPDAVRVGSKVYSFGQTTASATGTTVTPGTTADGTAVQVGSATTEPLWWWQVGYTCVDTTMSLATVHCDVLAGTTTGNAKILLADSPVIVTAAEQISNLPTTVGCAAAVATGQNIYVRCQSSATADSAISMMAWGLGG